VSPLTSTTQRASGFLNWLLSEPEDRARCKKTVAPVLAAYVSRTVNPQYRVPECQSGIFNSSEGGYKTLFLCGLQRQYRSPGIDCPQHIINGNSDLAYCLRY
jgi:hypothetical protein